MFDTRKIINIQTHILNLAIEAYFSQRYKNKYYPIIYLSKKLQIKRPNYNIYIKALLKTVLYEKHREYIL